MCEPRHRQDRQHQDDLNLIHAFVGRFRSENRIVPSKEHNIKASELDGNPVEFLFSILVPTETGCGAWDQVIKDPYVAEWVAMVIRSGAGAGS